jgi:chemotaxis family two-component system response regulator Rcp1
MRVLLVEDNPGDVRLTQEAFLGVNNSVYLLVACDGKEAISLLKQEENYTHAPRPDLILLDLNLPKMGGQEVLALIKADDCLRAIPTIVLTTSDAESGVEKSHQLQASCYVVKPVQLDAFERLVKSVNDFWLTKVKLPPQRQPQASLPIQASK